MQKFWDSEEIFYDGDVYFERLLQDIDQAKSYITIEMYIFNDDILGKKLVAHLLSAQARGVKIQIIVDGIGSFNFRRLQDVLAKKGVVVKMYNPLPFYHPLFGKLNFTKRLQVIGSRIWRLNSRDHRKIVTIDQRIMYTGSFNITAVSTKFHSEKPWKDMGVRVSGEHVKYTVLNFKKIWKLRDFFRYKKQIKNSVNLNWRVSPLRLNQSIFMKRFFNRDFLIRIHKSKKRIWFMTPYFIPKRRLIRALGKAAKRGVDVRILISLKTDVTFFKWLQYFYYAYLLQKGVKVYQYTDSVMHAKNYIIDDFITIGSTNLNHRSFMHDLEVDLVIQDGDNKKDVEDHFASSTGSLKMITLEGLKKRPLWDRILSRLFFLFKYWF